MSVVGLIGVGAAISSQQQNGRPLTPADNEVVAFVPARATDPVTREIARLNRAMAVDAFDPSIALRLARLHLDEGRKLSDPRHYGRAEAVLTPWCDAAAPNPEALVLRAVVHQARHKFVQALADLKRALALSPHDGQGWLVQASILTVLGRYAQAQKSCDEVARVASRFVAAACRAPVEGLQGQTSAAAASLRLVMDEARGVGERAWGESLLGDLALWSGDLGTAELHFQRALALDPTDKYSRAAYADLLLETKRAPKALRLLSHAVDDEGLLLRLVLAEQAVGSSSAKERARGLRARFDADRLRGEPVHGREEARFALWVEKDPKQALEVATENWKQQHEPSDARVLLEAALAAGQPQAARPAIAWVEETHFEDPQIRALVARMVQKQ